MLISSFLKLGSSCCEQICLFNPKGNRQNIMSSIRHRLLGLASGIVAGLGFMSAAAAAEPVKVGILHSLTGTMTISEITLKDTILMLVDEQNKKGGVLGRPLEAVVVDPKSDWPTFATSAEKLLGEDKAAVVFGCWTSVSRKHVLPVFEKHNGLLFYPVQYEGQEQSPNVVYTGATPNQHAIPAVEYLMSADGGSVKRFYLAGTDSSIRARPTTSWSTFPGDRRQRACVGQCADRGCRYRGTGRFDRRDRPAGR
jgi:hypothetical protein